MRIIQWILEKLLEDKDISKSIVKCGRSVIVDTKSKNGKPGYDTAHIDIMSGDQNECSLQICY